MSHRHIVPWVTSLDFCTKSFQIQTVPALISSHMKCLGFVFSKECSGVNIWHYCLLPKSLMSLIWLTFFIFVFREQYGVYRSAGQTESSIAHSQSGRLWFSGGQRRRSGPQVRWAAALLQHTVPAVHRPAGGRGLCPQWQVELFVVLGVFSPSLITQWSSLSGLVWW